jgi:hypothetical protein
MLFTEHDLGSWPVGRLRTNGGESMASIVELAAVIVDCAAAGTMVTFYQAACGGDVIKTDGDSAWLKVGGATVIFREVAGYRTPTWPSADVPMQIHLDFAVDDLGRVEKLLWQHGATTPEYQPHRDDGHVVMLDPAGHPFCIGTRR